MYLIDFITGLNFYCPIIEYTIFSYLDYEYIQSILHIIYSNNIKERLFTDASLTLLNNIKYSSIDKVYIPNKCDFCLKKIPSDIDYYILRLHRELFTSCKFCYNNADISSKFKIEWIDRFDRVCAVCPRKNTYYSFYRIERTDLYVNERYLCKKCKLNLNKIMKKNSIHVTNNNYIRTTPGEFSYCRNDYLSTFIIPDITRKYIKYDNIKLYAKYGNNYHGSCYTDINYREWIPITDLINKDEYNYMILTRINVEEPEFAIIETYKDVNTEFLLRLSYNFDISEIFREDKKLVDLIENYLNNNKAYNTQFSWLRK